MALYFKSIGHDVECVSPDSGYYSDFLERNGVRCNSGAKDFDFILISYFVPDGGVRGFRVWVQHDVLWNAPEGGVHGYICVSEEALAKIPQDAKSKRVIFNGVSPDDYCRRRVSGGVERVYSLSHSDDLNARLKALCDRHGLEFLSNNKFTSPSMDIRQNLEWADLVVGVGRSAYEAAMYGRPVLLLDQRSYNGCALSDGLFHENFMGAIKSNCSGRKYRLILSDDDVLSSFKGIGVGCGELSREVALEFFSLPDKAASILEFYEEIRREYGGISSFPVDSREVDIRSWLASRSIGAESLPLVKDRFGEWPGLFVFVLDAAGDSSALQKTLSSLVNARSWSAKVAACVISVDGDISASGKGFSVCQETGANFPNRINVLVESESFDWFMILEAGDELLISGLIKLALETTDLPSHLAISCDGIYRQPSGILAAAFRPSFNLDYLLSFPVAMARHWLFRREVVLEVGGFDPSLKDALELDLILRLINQGGLVGLGHLAEPLLVTDLPALANVEDERRAIIRHLQARGYPDAQVTAAKPGRYNLKYKHISSPGVSILILTGSHLSKLQRCIEGLLGSTAYQTFEILLIENHPQDQAVHEWLLALAELQEAKLRVVQPVGWNMAAMLNQAAHRASGDYLLFLAPDTAIVEEDWLDNLLNHAQRAEVGGVGGRLLTPDGKIAQAMQILGLQGPLGNPYVGEKLDEPGYMQRLQVDQNVSALSQDCLMLPRDLYVQLEGLDEEGIPSPYAMTDLCLRIREAGYLLVWSPSVQLMLDRQESTEVTAQQQDAMYAKWLPQLARDPSYNPNFSLAQPGGFKLADTQISWRPLDIWRPLPVVLAHPADTMGCGHYRVMQPFNALREAGIVDGALSVGLMHVVDLERYNPDAVVLQRQIGEERLEAMRRIKAFSRAFKVYELDDYLPNLPMKSAHRQHMPKDIVKSLRRGLSYVDRFVVSTDVMAEAFAEFHPDIRVVTNRLDPRWWGGLSTSARRTSSKPRVGWAGGASHTGDLEMIADVVKELAGEVEWVFFGMCPEKLKPYIHEFHEGVAIERYAKKLASLNIDLALAPVEQNLFNECKSNLRLLEYGACGFPVICSDVRCYQGDGLPVTRVKNRFRDWVDAIRSHINDLDAAARAGDDLRTAVLNSWMLEGENLEAWRRAWLPD
ncbi:MAG: glycosyltransferase [Pseudomonas sp.]